MGVIPGYRRQLEIEGLMGIEDLAGTRPGHGEEVYADRQLVVARTALPAGLRFTGEIDASNAAAVPASLAVSEARDGAVHLDLSSLMFIDISGIRAFISAGENAAGSLLPLADRVRSASFHQGERALRQLRGRLAGYAVSSARMPTRASITPSMPPMSDSSTPSVMN